MSLWQEYEKNMADLLVEDVTSSMEPMLYAWLEKIALNTMSSPYEYAILLKNKFRVKEIIPHKRPNNYLEAPEAYKFAMFLMKVARTDSILFFTILDYIIQTHLSFTAYASELERILDDAGHKFSVQAVNDMYVITERLPSEQKELMDHILKNELTYASEFRDSFAELYGVKPNYTHASGEAFQALESALKFYLGEDKGDNLGAILNWLDTNRGKWHYEPSSNGQDDANEQFISLVNFVNKSYRKTKHGQANEKLSISKTHSEVILRSVALLIFQLEHVIKLTKT